MTDDLPPTGLEDYSWWQILGVCAIVLVILILCFPWLIAIGFPTHP